MVVSPTKLMAQRVSAMAVRPDMENILERFINKKDTLLDLEEVIVPKTSWLVLRKLKEAHFREIAKAFVIGITQKDGKYIPSVRKKAMKNPNPALKVKYWKRLILK